MKSARKKPTTAKLRSWGVSIIRKRGQYLGTVEAPNEKAAEAAAVAALYSITSSARADSAVGIPNPRAFNHATTANACEARVVFSLSSRP